MIKIRRISSGKVVAAGFLAIIFLGAFLLNTPLSSKNGEAPGFVNALFTSASAVCVTGLSVLNTGSFWSPFGKCVILILIQIGGLGFMTVAAVISLAFKRKISLKERLIMADSMSRDEISGIVRLMKAVIFSTAFFELAGAVILSVRFSFEYGVRDGIVKGVFHSVSAFCNAGFDILSDGGQSSSLSEYIYDPVVNITIMLLTITGGLGFFTWADIARRRSFKRLSTQTKVVLSSSAILIFGGAALIFAFESRSGSPLAEAPLTGRITASLFQSVTCRTAGFETVAQSDFSAPTRLLSMLLMFIGGAPGSTAGGIKIVTAAVLLMSAVSVIRGNENTNLFKRRINPTVIKRAHAILLLAFSSIFVSAVAVCALEDLPAGEIFFEVVSAFGTVGLSCGITSSLGQISKIILIFLMYFGRIGVLTISMAIAERSDGKKDLFRYSDAGITVG